MKFMKSSSQQTVGYGSFSAVGVGWVILEQSRNQWAFLEY
jgi:hypothetical protein